METPDQEEVEPHEPTPRCYWALGLMGLGVLGIQGILVPAILVQQGVRLPSDVRFALAGSCLVVSFVAAALSSFLAVTALWHPRLKTRDRVERGLLCLAIVVDVSAIIFDFYALWVG